jgi:hypothetical protein
VCPVAGENEEEEEEEEDGAGVREWLWLNCSGRKLMKASSSIEDSLLSIINDLLLIFNI